MRRRSTDKTIVANGVGEVLVEILEAVEEAKGIEEEAEGATMRHLLQHTPGTLLLRLLDMHR